MKILVVDDEKSIRTTLSEFLREDGYTTQMAEDVDDAKRCLAQQAFDVVLTDIILPRATGVDLLKHVRQVAPDTLVIIMTGEPTVDTAVEAVRAGAHNYLTKPISKQTIQQAVRQAARIKSLMDDKVRLEALTRHYQQGLEQMVEERTRSLKNSEALYESLVQHLPQYIVQKDLQGRFLFANQHFCQLVGKPLPEILGRSDADFFPAEQAAKYVQDDQRALSTGETLEFVEEMQIPGHGRRYSQAIKTPLYDGRGEALGVQIIFWDVTEKKIAEDQLRQLSRAVDQAPVSIVITDAQGNIVFANPKFTEVSGYPVAEVLGKNPRILKSGETPPEEYQRLWATITSGQEWHGEFHNRRKNGALFWENARISPLRDAAGAITHYVAVKEDITDKKQLEAQFLRSQRLESIGALAGGVAHDLNNILAPILMSTALLRDTQAHLESDDMLQLIENSARRGSDIVKQLLTFSRGSQGQRVPVQMQHLSRDMDQIIHETFPKSIELRVQRDAHVSAVLGDPTQMHQILMNLCVNARDAMPEGGTLTLRLEEVKLGKRTVFMMGEVQPGVYVKLTVADTGTGIQPEHLDRIFDPFFTTKPEGKGTGLGLSTVLGIVKSHNGCLNVITQPGKGTAFEIYFPACLKPASGVPANNNQALPQGDGRCVLVVDDEVSMRTVTVAILKKNGYQVLAAQDGKTALAELAACQDIRVVLSDLMMPGMDGVALVRELQRTHPNLPVIIMSGMADSGDVKPKLAILESMGVTRVIAKPFENRDLLEMLHKTIS